MGTSAEPVKNPLKLQVQPDKTAFLRSCIIPIFLKNECTQEILPKPYVLLDVSKRLDDICTSINQQHGFLRGTLKVDGRRVASSGHKEHHPAYYHLNRKVWLYTFRLPSAKQIFCRTVNGKTIALDVDGGDTVREVKKRIKAKSGHANPDAQDKSHLKHGGRYLEDHRLLDDYRVERESTLLEVMSLCGGGANEETQPNAHVFSNMEKSKTTEWSKSAPEWRRAQPGLCLEGPCTNKQCKAFKNLVICNMGMREFSLQVDSADVQCPLCKEHVVPVTSGFNNCRFYFFGLYTSATGGPIRQESKPELIGDKYKRFDEFTKDGKAATLPWDFLKIVAMSSDDKIGFVCTDIECPICLDHMHGKGDVVLECGHRLHNACHKLWLAYKATCPQCQKIAKTAAPGQAAEVDAAGKENRKACGS